MERIEEIFTLLEEPMEDRFLQGVHDIEACIKTNAKDIAVETISTFREAARQALKLQKYGEKGPIRYLVISHLYSSIQTGRPAAKLDLFDGRFYADRADIDVYLPLKMFYKPLEEDMAFFKEVVRGKIARIREYEWEQVRYRHVWSYHAVVREYLKVNIEALLQLPEFEELEREAEFEVLFGGYMDRAVWLWPRKKGAI